MWPSPLVRHIFARDVVRTHRMAVHPSALLARSLGCAHRMAIHPCSQVARYLGWAHRVAIHPCFILQGVWDEPTVWPSPLVRHIFARDVARTHRMAVHPSALLARSLGCAHRMAIHPCLQDARYLGWTHRMAIHPCFILHPSALFCVKPSSVQAKCSIFPYQSWHCHNISHGLVGGEKGKMHKA